MERRARTKSVYHLIPDLNQSINSLEADILLFYYYYRKIITSTKCVMNGMMTDRIKSAPR